MRTARPIVVIGLTVAAVAGFVAAAGAQTEPVTFTDHIRPIMERSCWNCHGEAVQLSDLDLRTRDGALAGGTPRAGARPRPRRGQPPVPHGRRPGPAADADERRRVDRG